VLFNKTNRHPTMHISHHSRLNTGVASAMVRIVDNLSKTANIRAITTVAVVEASLNSIKGRSNTLNSINKLTRMPSCVVDEEGVEALPTMGHRLSKDASYTTQHRNLRTLSPKANTSMGSLHARFRSLK
jgi:uncharacterized protein related to proFAR isomerase